MESGAEVILPLTLALILPNNTAFHTNVSREILNNIGWHIDLFVFLFADTCVLSIILMICLQHMNFKPQFAFERDDV